MRNWNWIGLLAAGLLIMLTLPLADTFRLNILALQVQGRVQFVSEPNCSFGAEENCKYLLGVRARYEGNISEALQQFTTVKRFPSRHTLASYQLARIYEHHGDFDLAVVEWQEAGVASIQASRHLRRASSFFSEGKFDEGEQMLWTAAALEPDLASPFWSMASVYRNRDNEKMLLALQEGLHRDSLSAWSYVARGMIAEYRAPIDRETALDNYRYALYLTPNHAYGMRRRTEVSRDLGRIDEALLTAAQFIVFWPDDNLAQRQIFALQELSR